MTDDARDFIRQFNYDAYLALIVKMRAEAWADGYDAARRDVTRLDDRGVFQPDHPLYPAVAKLDEESGPNLRNRAYRELLDAQAPAEREAVVAMAMLGQALPNSVLERHGR